MISPQSFSSRAESGLGLIKRAMNGMQRYNFFIIYSSRLFIELNLKKITEF